MTTVLLVSGFVQIWNKTYDMIKSKEAYIEIVKGKKKDRLVIHFCNDEGSESFDLSNNVSHIVFRSFGANDNHMNITFRDNSFLFIDKLSYSDAEDLKMYLDRHQKKLPLLVESDPDSDEGPSSRTTPPLEGATSLPTVYEESYSGLLETTDEESEAVPQEVSSLESTSSTSTHTVSLESGHETSQKTSSGTEVDEDFLSKASSVSDKQPSAHPSGYVSHTQEKQQDTKDKRKVTFGGSFETRPSETSHLHCVRFLQTLSRRSLMAFLFKPRYNKEGLEEWEEYELCFDFFQEKQWQGLPNLGNTCYMNAVLQSLFAIPSFNDDLLSQGISWGYLPFDGLALCLVQLLALRCTRDVRVKEKLLMNIKQAIAAVSGMFSNNHENDAHEFLGHCLDQLKDSLKVLNAFRESAYQFEKAYLPQLAFSDDATTEVVVCPVTRNFEFDLQRSITCQGCGQVVLKTETNSYVSINLPQENEEFPVSIQTAFDLFFDVEELEYKCEKCAHNCSLGMHKFSKLPRVLIVLLKRYSPDKLWSFAKCEQQVFLPPYLNVSAHCNESTEPPPVLGRHANITYAEAESVSEAMSSVTISLLPPSTKSVLESTDSLTHRHGSDKELSRKQHKPPGKGSSMPSIGESDLVGSRLQAVREKKLPARGSKKSQEFSLPPIYESKPVSSVCPSTEQVRLPQVPEKPELTIAKKPSVFPKVASDSARVPEGSQEGAEQTRTRNWMKFCGQFSRQPQSSSFQKADARGRTESLRKSSESSFQETKGKLLGAFGSSKSSGSKSTSDKKKKEGKAKKQKGKAEKPSPEKKSPHAYRLISVISHVGGSPHSGHYVSEVYSFERQLWFAFSDMQVAVKEEGPGKEGRLSSGYIFFYLHNEIFEELLKREENSQPSSTSAGEKAQK